VVVMVLQRGVNFVLNQLLLRHVDPAVFGLASVPLDLLLNTALFLSREGFRLTLGRTTLVGLSSDTCEFRQFVNLSWVPVLLGPLVSLLSLAFLPSTHNEDIGGKGQNADALRQTGLLFCLAASLESLSEPAYLVCQGCLLTTLRSASEGLATLIRSIITFVLLVWVLPPEKALLAFGFAQVGYSVVLILVYWGYLIYVSLKGGGQTGIPGASKEAAMDTTSTSQTTQTPLRLLALSHLLPRAPSSSSALWVEPSHLALAFALTGQSFFKHLLTQGDKIVLSIGSSHYSQGLYALAQNYGSLAARLLFQPLEESGRLMFARLAAGNGGVVGEDGAEAADDKKKKKTETSVATDHRRGRGAEPGESAASQAMLKVLVGALVKTVILVGLVFACFGFNYTRVLLRLLLPGRRWETGAGVGAEGSGEVLSWYCLYVLFLAVNGMTEAFVYAVATQQDVVRLGALAAVSFAVFAGLTFPFIRWHGTVGLVLANCAGMLVRILFSIHFVRAYFDGVVSTRKQDGGEGHVSSMMLSTREKQPDMFPHPVVLASFVAAFAATYASDKTLVSIDEVEPVLKHVVFGGMVFTGVLGSILWTEQDFFEDLKSIRRLATGRREEAGSKAKSGLEGKKGA